MSDTLIPDTILAVFNACLALNTTTLAGVAISDGPVVQRGAEFKRLFIGTSPDSTTADGDNPESSNPGVIDNEIFSILSIAEVWGGGSGSSDLANTRYDLFAIRGAIRAILRPSPAGVTLGVPGLASARMGAWQLESPRTEKGIYLGMTFRIDCIAKPSVN